MHHRQHFAQMADVAKAIALPSDFAAVRYPSFPALERTATLAFSQQGTYNLSADNMRGMLTRSAVAPLWLQQQGKFVYGYSSRLPFKASDSNNQRALLPNGDNIHIDSFTNAWVGNKTDSTSSTDKAALQVTGAVSPRYDFPVIARDDALPGAPFIYVPAGYRLAMMLGTIGRLTAANIYSATPTNGTISWNLERWVAPGEVQSISLAALYGTTVGNPTNPGAATFVPSATYADVGGTTPFTVGMSSDGWYRLSSFSLLSVTTADTSAVVLTDETNVHLFVFPAVTTNPATVITATTNVNGTTTVAIGSGTSAPALLPYFKPPEWAVSSLPWSATRLTAVGALFTNVTKVLNKEGTVQAARLSPVTDSVYGQRVTAQVDSDLLAAKHPSEKALLSLDKGFYTYCPPSTDLQRFWDYSLNAGSYEMGGAGVDASMRQYECPCFRLDNDALINYFLFSDPSAATAGDGTSLAINLDFHIEFRSVSALWPIGLSTMSLEAFHQAQMALVATGFFFNNDDPVTGHSRIRDIVTSIARYLGGPIAGAAAPYLYDAGATILGKMQSDLIARRDNRVLHPKTTTVQASPPPSVPRVSGRASRRQRRRERANAAVPPKAKPAPQPSRPKMEGGLDQYLRSKSQKKP